MKITRADMEAEALLTKAGIIPIDTSLKHTAIDSGDYIILLAEKIKIERLRAYVPHFEVELMPHYNCNHRFVPIELPIKFWVSEETKTPPPDHAPIKIKCRCELCGGIEWFY